MGLSDKVNDIIEGNYKAIISDVPFKNILLDLRIECILTDDEVTQLNLCKDPKYAGFEFVKILRSRSDEDFFKFCGILKSSTIKHVQSLGRILENLATDKGQAKGEWYSYITLCFD